MTRVLGTGWRLLIALGCLGLAHQACATRQPTETTLTRVHRDPASAEAPVEISNLRVHYVLDEQGNYVRTFEQSYRVLTRSGVENWSQTGASWSPWYMAKPQISAKVTAVDGTTHLLDPATLNESPAYPETEELYDDVRVIRAPLPAITVGATVEEKLVDRTTQPFFGAGSAQYLVFQSGIPRKSVELRVEAPAALPLRYEIRGAEVTVSDQTRGGRRILVFRGGPYPALDPIEPNVPEDVPAWPYVAFSTGESWQELAQAYAEKVRRHLTSQPTPQLDVDGLLTGVDGDTAKANRLLGWMRERVRYIGLEFGESAIVPSAPAETLRRGFGDCKAQAVLLVALLQRAGIDAKLALLRAGSGEDVSEKLPAMNVFNHMIVVIPGDKRVWIDPTSRYARAGALPVSDQGRRALIVDSGAEGLVPTPVLGAEDNTYLEVREIHLPEQGRARIVETSESTGVIDEQLRSQFDGSLDEARKPLREYVKKTYGARDLGKIVFGAAADPSRPFSVTLEANDVTAAVTDLLTASVAQDSKVLFSWLPSALFDDEPRKMDLVLPTVYAAETRYRVFPPPGFVVKKPASPPTAKLGPVSFERTTAEEKDGSVTVRFRLSVPKRRWTPAEVTEFRKAVKRLDAEPVALLALEHEAQRLIEAHRVAEGLRMYSRAAASHPNDGIYLMRTAVNLVDAGLGSAARDLGRRAVSLAPDNAILQRTLGLILERDEFGRSLHRGYARTEAIAAFRRAAELDEDDTVSRLQVALLYEHDDEARRYADPEELARAVEAYDAIDPDKLRAYEGGTHRNNVLFALMWAGRFDAARERLERLATDDVPPAVALAVATALRGPVAGIAEADRLGLRGEPRSQALAAAGEVLVQMRRYQEGSALLAAASDGAQDSARYDNRVRLVAKVRAIDPAGLPDDSPASAVIKLVSIQWARDRVDPKLLERLVARDARGDHTGVGGFLEGLSRGHNGINARREAVLDFMVALRARRPKETHAPATA